MLIHANETRVQALITHVAPCADGYGHELDLEILGNESPDPNADFLKPKIGDHLMVFAVEPGALKEGLRLRATLALSGGPLGQRVVLRDAERVATMP
jgi:hypothetical protein